MNTAFEIYQAAGSPRRAVVRFARPVSIAKGRGSSKTTQEIEAYLTILPTLYEPRVGYYFNPNTYHVFYLPEEVTEIIPVDTMELWRRARQAARCIIEDRIYGRELDNAFENNDGAMMCAALVRLSQRSPKLDAALRKWASGNYSYFTERAARFSHLTDKQLSELAAEVRRTGVYEP